MKLTIKEDIRRIRFKEISGILTKSILNKFIRLDEAYSSTPTIGTKISRNEPGKTKNIKEEDFYRPFANWLENEVEEATIAIPLGGNKFGNKWGTPDVVGKKESKRSDIIKGGTEIVSAEIKSNTSQLITAFGQACAYKLFSHKCYLVIPKQSSQEDLDRLDSLSQLFGIGLVLFDVNDKEYPDFQIRTRPQKTRARFVLHQSVHEKNRKRFVEVIKLTRR